MARKVKIVSTVLSTDSAGNVVDALPVREEAGPTLNEAGKYVDPIRVEIDELGGFPVRYAGGLVTTDSAGKPVPVTPVTGWEYTFVNAEAEALVDRFDTPPPRAVKVAIDGFWSWPGIKPIMADADRFYLWRAADAQSVNLNWAGDHDDCTPVGGMIFTPYRDYQGDGVTGYIDPHFNPVTAVSPKFTQNKGALGFYSKTATASNNVDAGNTNTLIQCRSATDIASHRVNTASSNTIASTDGSGLFVVSRQLASGAGAMTLYRNGALVTTSQLASAAPADAPFRFFGRGGTVAFSGRRGVFGYIGADLTSEKAAILQGAVDQYLAAMGGGPLDFF